MVFVNLYLKFIFNYFLFLVFFDYFCRNKKLNFGSMRKFLFLFFFSIIGLGQMEAQSFQTGKSSQTANDKELIAYPNPAKDFLYLKTSDPNVKIKSATFYSILGNVVADVQINANYSEIRVDRLKQGKYLMRYVLSNNTQRIIQVIKQ